MIGLNLLPDVKKEFIKAQRTRNMVISFSILSMMIVGGLTVFLALFVYLGQEGLINLANGSITKDKVTLEQKPEINKYLTIQNQLSSLQVLHDKDHSVVYSRLFDYLTKLNPGAPYSVGLGSVKISKETNLINIQGMTNSPQMQALDVFKNTLEKAKLSYTVDSQTSEVPLFSEVVLKSATLSQDGNKKGVAFEFDLTYSPEIFWPNVTKADLIVTKQTVSNSQDNAPSELFDGSGKAKTEGN